MLRVLAVSEAEYLVRLPDELRIRTRSPGYMAGRDWAQIDKV